MPIMRNPFRKQDENLRPTTITGVDKSVAAGAPSVKPIDIKEKEPTEYQLSEINDSGVYLPPSPPERKPLWSTSSSRSTATTRSSNHRSVFNENEQFNISRESFDSYRRSFDISARSQIVQDSRPPRASLDSRTFAPPPPRSSNSFQRPSLVPAQTREEADAFEDVDIGAAPESGKPAQPKKRGLFSRITDSASDHSDRPTSSGENKSSSWHHFGGRKRGQSGQGSELGSIPNRETTPKPESQLRKEAILPPATTAAQAPQPPKQQQTPPQQQQQRPRTDTAIPIQPTTTSKKDAEVPQAKAGASAEDVSKVEQEMQDVDLNAPAPVSTQAAAAPPPPPSESAPAPQSKPAPTQAATNGV